MRYGVWAGSGEMDLYEMKNEFKKNNFALHYGGPWPKMNQRYNLYENRVKGGTFSEDFTTVVLDWSTDKIEMLESGKVQLSKKRKPLEQDGYYSDAIGATSGAPFNIPFYMIINLAVGGKYPGNATAETLLPAELTFDYIRVFGKN